jgi:hypothetical protein
VWVHPLDSSFFALQHGRRIVKTLAMIGVLALACGTSLPASAIEVVTSKAAAQPYPDLAAVPAHAVLAHWGLPELPEPEVVAMMLVGLVLIGYRASRDNDEKFK